MLLHAGTIPTKVVQYFLNIIRLPETIDAAIAKGKRERPKKAFSLCRRASSAIV